MKKLKIALCASEAVPYAKAGGLGDVIGALPKVLEKLGCEVQLFLPKYSMISDDVFKLKYNWKVGEFPVQSNGKQCEAHLYQGTLPGTSVKVNFIYCSHAHDNRWIYTNDPDENERFIVFNMGVMEMMKRLKWKPDIIHANDWPTGLLPIYLKTKYASDPFFADTRSVLTIHNIGYPGKFGSETVTKAGLSYDQYYPGGEYEFYGMFSFLKVGLLNADKITTVSETYAQEILTPDFGSGFDGILQVRKPDLVGILNGADYDIWDPANDPLLPVNYTLDTIDRKQQIKKELQEMVRLPAQPGVPLIGMISRMVSQKGFHLVEELMPQLMTMNIQMIILGSGDPGIEKRFKDFQYQYPEKLSVHLGYDNQLSHLIEAASDVFLMPSLYEPCGLNQIYSLRYGTVPIVRKTGGLADTIIDWGESLLSGKKNGNGFSFSNPHPEALLDAIRRALLVYYNPTEWRQIQTNGMTADFSWERSAGKYLDLYRQLVGGSEDGD